MIFYSKRNIDYIVSKSFMAGVRERTRGNVKHSTAQQSIAHNQTRAFYQQQ